MRPDTCAIFLNGFCPKKQLCDKSHDVKNCILGPNCPNNNCNLRHPPFCVNFLQGKCGFRLNGRFIAFSKCAFFHPAKDIEPTFPPILPPLLPIPRPALQPPTLPPHPHPRIPLLPDSTWYGRKIQDLESKIHKLSERLTISNKPDLEPPIVHPPHQPPYHPPSGLPHGTPHRFPHGAAASTPAIPPGSPYSPYMSLPHSDPPSPLPPHATPPGPPPTDPPCRDPSCTPYG